VQGSGDRAVQRFEAGQRAVEERGREIRRVKRRDVTTGHEGAAFAVQQQRSTGTVGLERIDCSGQAGDHFRRQRIDRRVGDAQHGDGAMADQGDGFGQDFSHRKAPRTWQKDARGRLANGFS